MIVIALIVALVFIYGFYMTCKSKPKPHDKVKFFAGTMGSGKSYISVTLAIAKYQTARFLWKMKIIKGKPHFFSNIPIQLRKMTSVERKHMSLICGRKIKNVNDVANFALETGINYRSQLERWGVLNEWLLKDHFNLKVLLPKNSTILIDELSLIADQYSHDNPLIREQMVFFVGFCRHWFLGKYGVLCANAQATDQVVKQIRTKFGIGVILSNFRRSCMLLPWYKVDCHETLNVDDVRVLDDTTSASNRDKPFYFGKFPYFNKYYNSHCYEPAYADKFVHTPDFLPNLTTRYLIDLQCSEEEFKEYKKNRDKYRAELFSAS